MTSRITSSDIPERLLQLAWAYGSDKAPLNVVLATNMISVGLDVDRLGLMAVMGQPQATAEYIQATSRVGRRNPGLVVVIYNSTGRGTCPTTSPSPVTTGLSTAKWSRTAPRRSPRAPATVACTAAWSPTPGIPSRSWRPTPLRR